MNIKILRGLYLYSQSCRLCHGRRCQEGKDYHDDLISMMLMLMLC